MTNQNPYGSDAPQPGQNNFGQQPQGQFGSQGYPGQQNPGQFNQRQANPGQFNQGQANPGQTNPAQFNAGQPNQGQQWQQDTAQKGNPGNPSTQSNAKAQANAALASLRSRPLLQLVGAGLAALTVLQLIFFTMKWYSAVVTVFGFSVEAIVNGWGQGKVNGVDPSAAEEMVKADPGHMVLTILTLGLVIGAIVLFFLKREGLLAGILTTASGVIGLLLLVLFSFTGGRLDTEEVSTYGGSVTEGFGAGYYLSWLVQLLVLAVGVWLLLTQRAQLLESSKIDFGLRKQKNASDLTGQQGFGGPAQPGFGPADQPGFGPAGQPGYGAAGQPFGGQPNQQPNQAAPRNEQFGGGFPHNGNNPTDGNFPTDGNSQPR